MVVAVTVCGYLIEAHKEWFPWLIVFQSSTYQTLTSMDARPARATHVATVEIDPSTIDQYFRGKELASPVFIERLIKALSAEAPGPAVIAVNLRLNCSDADIAASVHSIADCDRIDGQRGKEALQLLATLARVADRIPIVLATELQQQRTSGYYAEEPLVLDVNSLPRGVTLGFRNAAGSHDAREVPLLEDVHPPFGDTPAGALQDRYSLSLETVRAYESLLDISPRTDDEPRLARAIAQRGFVYSTFLKTSAIPHVSALDVLRNAPSAVRALSHRIVVIGVPDNSFDTPVGQMPGMYIHANYVEALLDDRVKVPVSKWFASGLDLVLALAFVIALARANTIVKKAAVIGIFIVPLALAYFLFVNLQYSLDFTLPLVLLFAHFGVEVTREVGRREGVAQAVAM